MQYTTGGRAAYTSSSTTAISVAVRLPGSAAPLLLAALALALSLSIAPSRSVASDTTTTLTAPDPQDCLTDVQGADDEPGQKDISEFCEAAGLGGADFELHASWNFDDVRWSGTNTGDSCGLFDTNGNGFADFALCVTVEAGPPATMKGGSPKLYTCGDDRPDRCTSSVEDTDGFHSMCMVNSPGQNDDPFVNDPVHTGSNACNGTNCTSDDTYILCWIEVDDLPVTSSCLNNACTNDPSQFCVLDGDCFPLTDVCSYPSAQPNSDPSDCIITPTAQDPCRDVDCSSFDDACNTGMCNSSTGQCGRQARADGTACGNQTNAECDSADTCLSGACASNLVAAGEACGSTSDTICDNPDTCDGAGNCESNVEITTIECRADAGECDVAELCDGAGSCPQDGFEPTGTSCGEPAASVCDHPDTCDGSGGCQANSESANTVCRQDASDCDVAEFCDGAGRCPDDALESAGTPCGDPRSTICDYPDTCDDSGSCQANFETPATVCRQDAGDCDVAELCDGEGSCPENTFEPAATTCGNPTATVCDNPDTCDGSGGCQSNFESSTTVCRKDAGECDVSESCDGEGNCPDDGFGPAASSCGDPTATVCDQPDTCDGSGSCQTNFESSTTVCRQDAGDCDVAELCNGEGVCPEDAFELAGTFCGDSTASDCDNPDTCDGAGGCQANFESSTTVCRQNAGHCDVAELCNGEGACPENAFEPTGSSCGSPVDSVCDNPDTCDGSGACRDNLEPTTSACRTDTGECDVAELCDGAGSCPLDAFEPTGAPCGSSADSVCDSADSCDGSGKCQNNFEPPTRVCRADAGQCDVPEHCDGEGQCPANAPEPSGTPCDDGEICTGADRCIEGECLGEPIQPTLTVIKEVVNDDEGPCEADDFQLLLSDGVSDTLFRVDLDPIDPTVGSATFQIEHETSYEVSELLGNLADFYQARFVGDCDGTASCARPDSVCTVLNDDIFHKNQTSIAFEWLSVAFLSGDESRTRLEGEFEITDQSEPGNLPDGLFVLLDDYALDWEYRISGDTTFQPSDWSGPGGGSLEINDEQYLYTCTYGIVALDSAAGNPAGYQSGDPVIFDERIVIHYSCGFDDVLPSQGLLRAVATAGVFTKSGQVFHTRQGFDLVSGTAVTTTTSTSTTTSTTLQPSIPLPEQDPSDGTTTTTMPGEDEPPLDDTPPTDEVPPYAGTCWDPDADGRASVRDALHMLRAAIALLHDGQICPIEVCDQNCDGRVTVSDVLVALKRSVGALECFTPEGCHDSPSCCS